MIDSESNLTGNLGYHPAPATTSLSADPSLYWDDIPNLDWFVRVRCHPSDNSGYSIADTRRTATGPTYPLVVPVIRKLRQPTAGGRLKHPISVRRTLG